MTDGGSDYLSPAKMDAEQVALGSDKEEVQLDEKEIFVVGDTVRHRVSLEKGIVDGVTYENSMPVLYDISIEFEKVIQDVNPWLLEKYVPFNH